MVRRFRRRGGMRRARSFIRRVVSNMGPIEAKRIQIHKLSIPSDAGTDFNVPLSIPLIECIEAQNEETESDGTNVAMVPLYSKLVGMKLDFLIQGMASSDLIRWMLVKFEDGESLITTLVDSNFHSSNDVQNNRELRRLTLAKGFLGGSDKTASRLRIFVKRKTLKRLGNMRENDRLVLLLAQDNTTSTIVISGIGTIYARLN